MCKCLWDTVTGICGCAKDTVCCCCNCVGCVCNTIIIAVVLLVVGGITVGLLYAFGVLGGSSTDNVNSGGTSTILSILGMPTESSDSFDDVFKKYK